MVSKRVGLLLGTFNPMHIGHISMIFSALNSGCVDKVLVIPAWQNPWKEKTDKPMQHYLQRLTTCLNMCKGLEHMNVGISTIEKELKPTYTYELLEHLLKIYPDYEFTIIGGTDVGENISKWKNGDWIVENFKLHIVDRQIINISSTEIRKLISEGKSAIPFINKETEDYLKTI